MLNEKTKEEFLNRLIKFLKIPSVSGNSKNKKDMLTAVKFLKQELLEIGFARTKIEELYAKGLSNELNNPVIYAERINNPKAKTVLIYGHYDVQPAEPLSLWKTSPFEPKIIDGKIFARGATDDKGQLYTHIAALKTLGKEWGSSWGVNIKILIEGEEESGGENIEKLIKDNPEKFKADVCLVSDSGFINKNNPTIEVGLRGIVYFELDVVLNKKDLHSGLYGGAVRNPLNTLVQILGNIQNKKTGEIKIPRFYDGVLSVSKTDRNELNKIPYDKKSFLEEVGARDIFGEEGFTTIERTTIRPSFDLNGISGGFSGEGTKTIIPSKASAKFSIRTVPNQDPKKIAELVINYIKKISPKEVAVNLKVLNIGNGFLCNTNSPYLLLAKKSLKKIFKKEPLFSRSGGSIPIVSLLSKKLKAEVVLMGYGLPDDNLHSPNEKFDLEQFYRGIECNIFFLKEVVNLGLS